MVTLGLRTLAISAAAVKALKTWEHYLRLFRKKGCLKRGFLLSFLPETEALQSLLNNRVGNLKLQLC